LLETTDLLMELHAAGHQTWRGKARQLIRESVIAGRPISTAAMVMYGWCAAGQNGEPPSIAWSMFQERSIGETVTDVMLEAYATGYHYGQETALLMEQAQPVRITKTGEDDYKQALRRAVQAFWNGTIERGQFVSQFRDSVELGLGRAWREGIAMFGFSVDDLTGQEFTELETDVVRTFPSVQVMAERVIANKAANGNLGPLTGFVNQQWGNRYEQFKIKGRAVAGKDRKAMWVLGIAEHCRSCLKLAGKVRRWSWWIERGILPRVPGADYLECAGYN
jgi:hypothetical protein